MAWEGLAFPFWEFSSHRTLVCLIRNTRVIVGLGPTEVGGNSRNQGREGERDAR